MAYTRLLRAYYRTERPIACDQAYRLARASSKAQRAAVDSVLGEFFNQQQDGYHNKRADEEIAAYQAQADTNRRIAQGRSRQRTVNESLNESSTKHTPNHKPEPLTKNQEPEQPKSNPLSGKPDVEPPAKLNGSAHYADAEDVLTYLNRSTGKGFEFRNRGGELTASADRIIARLKQGYTREELREVVHAKCSQWASDDKMAEYLRPITLFGKEKFEQYLGELRGTNG